MKPVAMRWLLIGIAAAAIVVMAPSDNDGNSVSPARTSRVRSNNSTSLATSPEKQRQQTVGRVELERLTKLEKQQEARVGDVFSPIPWHVAPPAPKQVIAPPPPPSLPPAPTAPPLPFTYLGRYDDTASSIIILAKGERIYTVAVGDVIENTYRVEKSSAGTVVLTYLPLNIEQSLRTGEAS